MATELQRQRRTRREHFDTEEEYRVFADRRNEATKKCRKEKEEKLRSLSDQVPRLRAENKCLRERVRKLEAAAIADNEKDRKIAGLERRVRELEKAAMAKVGLDQGPALNDSTHCTRDFEDWGADMDEEWSDLVNLPGGENDLVSPAFMSFILDDDSKA